MLIGASTRFEVQDYDLDATLSSGQAFRWRKREESWVGVVGGRWVRLRVEGSAIAAETAEMVTDWRWLSHYLQADLDLSGVVRDFPKDEPMQAAVAACWGLRLLRQDPWECLASFILSSTKQIVQIQQIIGLLCERYGESVPVPEAAEPARSFPCSAHLATAEESELRSCKMGFRAKYLRESAALVESRAVDLDALGHLPVEAAREALMRLPGVGRKIADCVLLFAYGFPSAFPVDVWVMKALQRLYFPARKVNLQRLHKFAERHFAPNGGYAQQYLFHYMRTKTKPEPTGGGTAPETVTKRV